MSATIQKVGIRSVWLERAEGPIAECGEVTVNTIAEAYTLDVANAIEGLRAWDIAHMDHWRRAIIANNWLPPHAIDDVIRYYLEPVTV